MKTETKISILKSDGFMSIIVDGHNNNPILCAGISAIMQTCELGLKSLSLDEESIQITEREEF